MSDSNSAIIRKAYEDSAHKIGRQKNMPSPKLTGRQTFFGVYACDTIGTSGCHEPS